jgi:glycine cleavage system H protein
MKKDLFYTRDHEWIEFRGTVAYAGICGFKLKGINNIQRIKFGEINGFKEQGELVVTVYYDDYEIPFHMPVHGRVVNFNEMLLSNNNLLLEQPEDNGWIAFIVPAQPYERKGLLLPQQYRMNGKGKYAK